MCQAQHTQQYKWICNHIVLFNLRLYWIYSQKVKELLKSAQIQVKKFIISSNLLFHSSNSYINLCRLLELVGLTWFLCWHFQRPASEKLSLARLPAEISLWLPEEHDGRWMPAKCARGEERRYTWLGSWEQLFVSTRCSLLLFESEDEQVLSGTGWFWSKSGQISRHTCTCRHTVLLRAFIIFMLGFFQGSFTPVLLFPLLPFHLHSASNSSSVW